MIQPFFVNKDGDRRLKLKYWIALAVIAAATITYGVQSPSRKDPSNGTSKQGVFAPPKENPRYFIANETEQSAKTQANAETERKIAAQIAKETEEGNGYLPTERANRIRDNYYQQYKEAESAQYRPTLGSRLDDLITKPAQHPLPKAKDPQKAPKEVQPAPNDRYKTLSERIAEEGLKAPQKTNNQGLEFKTHAEDLKQASLRAQPTTPQRKDWNKAKNILPRGTFIACVLDADINTTDLQSRVCANVVLDVTFRRQLQLPQGLVKMYGTTSREPVQNRADIVFDTILFSDGTELPISGFAYAAMDPRYPDKYKTRGIPGEVIVPPMYTTLLNLIYTAGQGTAEGYAQAFTQGNTSTTTQGNVSTTTTSRPISPGALALATAGKETATELLAQAKADLAKYKPYVVIEKGTPFFIHIDKTVDVDDRRINGVELAKQEQEEALAARGVKIRQAPETYAPGDARAKYVGPNASSDYLPEPTGPDLNALKQMLQTMAPPTQPAATTTPPGALPETQADALRKIFQSIR
jgi:type IV secretory pathway VirB10-like protein